MKPSLIGSISLIAGHEPPETGGPADRNARDRFTDVILNPRRRGHCRHRRQSSWSPVTRGESVEQLLSDSLVMVPASGSTFVKTKRRLKPQPKRSRAWAASPFYSPGTSASP